MVGVIGCEPHLPQVSEHNLTQPSAEDHEKLTAVQLKCPEQETSVQIKCYPHKITAAYFTKSLF